jgi:O-acetyl-ADP-ribose deacetylase (regulator of RNase III)
MRESERITVVRGDITTLDVDAIVNAANSALAGGGGVDGAIHRAAGPELVRASRALAPCPAGECRVTPGFDLRARYVIHAVGPRWRGGDAGEPEQLASAYRSSLEAARELGVRSVAFPAISTGIYGYPHEDATAIAIETVRAFVAAQPLPERVVFCCFAERTEEAYRRALAEAR